MKFYLDTAAAAIWLAFAVIMAFSKTKEADYYLKWIAVMAALGISALYIQLA